MVTLGLLSVRAVALGVAHSMATLIVTSYAVWLAHGGEVWLPTISHTWEDAPMSYVSRWTIGMLTLPFALTNVAGYYNSQRGNADAILAALAVGGVFCFSWVGAICDDTLPACRGNNAIHSAFAITFFMLYDIYMFGVAFFRPIGRRASAQLKLCAVASAASKIRWLPIFSTPFFLAAFPWLPVLEWGNVAVVIAWTELSTRGCALDYAALDVAPEARGGPTAAPLSSFVTTAAAGAVALATCFGTLIATLAAGVATQTLPPQAVPFISDLWVYQPGDWFARWGVVHGAQVAILGQVLVAARCDPTGALPQGLAVVALVALSVVGVVDEVEDPTVHFAAAFVWFAGYDAFLLATARYHRHRAAVLLIFCATLVVQCMRFAPRRAYAIALRLDGHFSPRRPAPDSRST